MSAQSPDLSRPADTAPGRRDALTAGGVPAVPPTDTPVRLLALPLEEASVKIRTGPPSDGDSPEAALSLWAGELPLAATSQQPVPDPGLPPGTPIPAHIRSRACTRADRSPNSKPES